MTLQVINKFLSIDLQVEIRFSMRISNNVVILFIDRLNLPNGKTSLLD